MTLFGDREPNQEELTEETQPVHPANTDLSTEAIQEKEQGETSQAEAAQLTEYEVPPLGDITPMLRDLIHERTSFPAELRLEKERLISRFQRFTDESKCGLSSLFNDKINVTAVEALINLENAPLTKANFNFVLSLSSIGSITSDFMRHYFLPPKGQTPYAIAPFPGDKDTQFEHPEIRSLDQLEWGLTRIYTDALLHFGNINAGFDRLREMNELERQWMVGTPTFSPAAMAARGAPLGLKKLDPDGIHLVGEICAACFGDDLENPDLALYNALHGAYRKYSYQRTSTPKVQELLTKEFLPDEFHSLEGEFQMVTSRIHEQELKSPSLIKPLFLNLVRQYVQIQLDAIHNTRIYNAMTSELDVYTATSMRSRDDFLKTARSYDAILSDERLKKLHLRVFDPTSSVATDSHDKGLLENLMVNRCKVLVYHAGEKDSFGKAVEAGKALMEGKIAIFLCDNEAKYRTFQEIHPLSRMANSHNGVANGALVARNEQEVSTLLYKIFHNQLSFDIEQPKTGKFELREKTSGSVYRLQSNDAVLTDAFWEYCQGRDRSEHIRQTPNVYH